MNNGRQDKILAIIKLLEEECGSTKLMKAVFLIEALTQGTLGFQFFRYHYGPFSNDFQVFLDQLVAKGKVTSSTTVASNYLFRKYQLRPNTLSMASLAPSEIAAVEFVKKHDLQSLLKKLYTAFNIDTMATKTPIPFNDTNADKAKTLLCG